MGVWVQTEGGFVTSIVCPEQFVHFFCLEKVLYDTYEHIQICETKARIFYFLAGEPWQCVIFWILLSNVVYLFSSSARKWLLSRSYFGSGVRKEPQNLAQQPVPVNEEVGEYAHCEENVLSWVFDKKIKSQTCTSY